MSDLMNEDTPLFNLRATVVKLKKTMYERQAIELQQECATKPKLRTFMLFKNFSAEPNYNFKTLTFYERRLLARTRLGCLSIHLETGRYSKPRIPEVDRICLVCNSGQIESEEHFLFQCMAYEHERLKWLDKLTLLNEFETTDLASKLDCVFNNHHNIKPTAKFISIAYDLRSKILSQRTN